jgi:hypothetical protein
LKKRRRKNETKNREKTKKRKEKKYTENKKKEKGRNGPGLIADQDPPNPGQVFDIWGVPAPCSSTSNTPPSPWSEV